ncbi:MAG: transposase [Firmicutes bacterium]|nr:transposase [Bacillota bacterium]
MLSKTNSNDGWRNFIGILSYKEYSVIKKTFPQSQKKSICDCGNVLHRDVNAAMNLSQQAMISFLTN